MSSKTGGTAEGPAFRPGRTKAGYVFLAPERGRTRRTSVSHHTSRTKFILDEDRIPRVLVQHRRRPAGAAAAAAASRARASRSARATWRRCSRWS